MAVKRASNLARTAATAASNGLVLPSQAGDGISVIMVFPSGSCKHDVIVDVVFQLVEGQEAR